MPPLRSRGRKRRATNSANAVPISAEKLALNVLSKTHECAICLVVAVAPIIVSCCSQLFCGGCYHRYIMHASDDKCQLCAVCQQQGYDVLAAGSHTETTVDVLRQQEGTKSPASTRSARDWVKIINDLLDLRYIPELDEFEVDGAEVDAESSNASVHESVE
ncbi:hypothetical protein EDC01DRAFT_635177 [Geopyxis carbonaria]|nr:hypothetical protein EDC01DRAFT_635177 [Geopyxis carbonaria]